MREKSIVIHGKDESEENHDEIFTDTLIKQMAVGNIKIKFSKESESIQCRRRDR